MHRPRATVMGLRRVGAQVKSTPMSGSKEGVAMLDCHGLPYSDADEIESDPRRSPARHGRGIRAPWRAGHGRCRRQQVLALGDIHRPVFPRSAVKVLQALPLVASGAADALQLDDEALALACASHNGEPAHVATAARMLARAGVDLRALECGAHWPYHEAFQREMAARGETPSALHNNCSGKHAGFICLACRMAGEQPLFDYAKGYVGAGHPVMREVTQALQATTGWDLATAPQGIDGCSIPTFGIPLLHLARAFARVGSGIGLSPDHARAARRLRQAVSRAPFMVGGTDRFDTRVMQRLGERVFCKVGAEGVYCAPCPGRGLGVALKVDDGNNARAAEVVMAAVIEAYVRARR